MSVATFAQEAQTWLGQLPAGWQVQPLKHVVRVNPEALSDSTDPDWRITYADISSVSLGRGIVDANEFPFADAPSRARRIVRPGDTLVSTVRTYLRAITEVRDPPENLVASTGFAVLRPGSGIDANFLGYFSTSDAFVNAVVAQSVGVSYPATNASDIVRLPIAFPDIERQQQIAAFLDRKTAEIDTLIAKKRRLLDRLTEKRTALIARAVTKGLNPDAPMNDSGIEWLGEIPAHWEVCGLGQKIKLQRGVDITESEHVDGPYPVISSGGIEYFNDTYFCSGPGVLIGRKGSAGKLHFVESDYWPHDTTLYVREFRGNVPRFVWYLLHTLDMTNFDTGSSNPTVNRNRVHPMKTAWPPSQEQHSIAAWLDEKFKIMDAHSGRVISSIALLAEYRSSLITSAVTGQSKVA